MVYLATPAAAAAGSPLLRLLYIVTLLPMDELLAETFDRIVNRGFDPRNSSFPDRVVVLVVSAQGIIDNGGFAYFHSLPFDPPADPEDFERVYTEIGADECAAAFREALTRHRAQAADANYDDLDLLLNGASEEIYARLTGWILEHEAELR
jgi:hypothetical protein